MFGLGKFISAYTSPHYSDGVKVSLDELIAEQANAFGILPNSSHRTRVSGLGGFRSPFKGRGMEFDEIREYKAGDDIRNLDWKVTAKVGKPFTKLFHEERERPIFLLVDMRPPMRFATKVAFKSVIAARIASMIVWSAKSAGDKLGGIVISSGRYVRLKPRKQRRHMLGFLGAMTEASADSAPKGGTSLAKAASDLRHVTGLGGAVFIISDFSDFDDDVKKQLAMIASRSDLICVYIEDKLEGTAPPSGIYRINDGFGRSLTINTADEKWRKEYEQTFKQRKNAVKEFCVRAGCLFIPIATDDNLADALRKGLRQRKQQGTRGHYAA
jgi:uncharacterized protein (DUF58 family)